MTTVTPRILIHGGAGSVALERHDRLRAGVRAAAATGHAILARGGSALDAVVAAVRALEDDAEFNAGLGSALTRDGTVETDASVMDGATHRVGGVAAVPNLGMAIALARAVLDAGEHVLLAGPAALQFAAEVGISPAAPGALVTERTRTRLAQLLAPTPPPVKADAGPGTVGAVALDDQGRFAAATSTGGTWGKRAGRVGDSPIPGAGTWADTACAISATGDGEAILRVALARSIAARLATGEALEAAVRASLDELHRMTGGHAGVIALDRHGWVGVQHGPTMPIAWIDGEHRGDTMGSSI
ncbi:MAG: Isoaspartyl aminopeptidase [Deltaproteobacteria bacterium]|nr:Isoaspartyl aminopeptidase [Deltaproteobacteria bacterium]